MLIDDDNNNLRLLADIAITGACYGFAEPARKIFEGLAMMKADDDASCRVAVIGAALLAISKNDYMTASSILEKSIESNPDFDEAKLFLVLSYKKGKRNSERAEILLSELESSSFAGVAQQLQEVTS